MKRPDTPAHYILKSLYGKDCQTSASLRGPGGQLVRYTRVGTFTPQAVIETLLQHDATAQIIAIRVWPRGSYNTHAWLVSVTESIR